MAKLKDLAMVKFQDLFKITIKPKLQVLSQAPFKAEFEVKFMDLFKI